MNRLSREDRERAVACLVEGNSQRAACRITGLAKKTVARLALELGEACAAFAETAFNGITSQRIQCDEIWSFVGCKQKNATPEKQEKGMGDVWTWVAIDPETKLVPCWWVGDRSAQSAYSLLRRLSQRLANKIQLSTDGLRAYVVAVETAWAWKPIDYGMLVKLYGEGGEGRYSPAECIGARKETVLGDPKHEFICTSHVERQNLTARMQMRRFTRLTNAFSKKLENHINAVAMHYIHYNFCRIHSSIRCTPAMEAGITDHVWELSELIGLLEAREQREALAA